MKKAQLSEGLAILLAILGYPTTPVPFDASRGKCFYGLTDPEDQRNVRVKAWSVSEVKKMTFSK